jgi:hypothetical protein
MQRGLRQRNRSRMYQALQPISGLDLVYWKPTNERRGGAGNTPRPDTGRIVPMPPNYTPLTTICPQCGGKKVKQAVLCFDCRHPNRHTSRVCPDCGGKKSHIGLKCFACYKADHAHKHVCPQCGGPKMHGAKVCRSCHFGTPVTTTTCSDCGGPMAKKRKGKLCISCYKRNGRLEPVHRDDGSTLLPLPHGRFAVIDTEDFERVKDYSWHLSGNGYVLAIMPDRKKKTHFLLHRVIMDPPSDMVIDHINHDTLDNRKTNLRICTQRENMQNSTIWKATTERLTDAAYAAGTPPTEPKPPLPDPPAA